MKSSAMPRRDFKFRAPDPTAAWLRKQLSGGRGWRRSGRLLAGVLLFEMGMIFGAPAAGSFDSSKAREEKAQSFTVTGIVRNLAPDGQRVVIQHEAIPGYMDAMTMPFKAREPKELNHLQAGDEISFRLQVTETESWIDRITRIGTRSLPESQPPVPSASAPVEAAGITHPLRDFKFTNELGQAVSLNDFRGQALAITFFFTRCPIPDYCPRLSRNFQAASQKLAAIPGAPTNWHFLSVSFDTAMDTPAVLKAYGERYQYDPAHWSFLTGPKEKINELASLSGVLIDEEAGLFNHNFRTLIIDASGRLQTTFPFGGDLAEVIAREILKAAALASPAALSDAAHH
jgi:protein SCO1/2